MVDGNWRILRGAAWAFGLAAALVGLALSAQEPGPDEPEGPGAASGPVIASKSSHVFHRPTCSLVKSISARNRTEYLTADEAIAAGYKPCIRCKPTEAPGAEAHPASKGAAKHSGSAHKGSAVAQRNEALDKKVEEVGKERWGKTSAAEPEITRGNYVILFSKMSAERARSLTRIVDAQVATLVGLIGTERSRALAGPEKLSLYVFPSQNTYDEFMKAIEGKPLDPVAATNGEAHANFGIEKMPYISGIEALKVGANPGAAKAETKAETKEETKADDADETKPDAADETKPEPKARAKRSTSSRKAAPARTRRPAAGAAASSERTIVGLITEQLVVGACNQAGQVAPWVTFGLAAYMAEQVDPRSGYNQRLHKEFSRFVGRSDVPPWNAAHARQVLDQGDDNQHRVAGLAFFEFLGSTRPALITPVVQVMALEQGHQFDEVLKRGFFVNNADRVFEGFGQWAMRNYGE